MSYLYGASVQGIQDFIFKTNKLQEIVGASEIVKRINADFVEKYGKKNSVKILLNAAGNIKAIFHDKSELETFILDFSKNIQQKAYGITLSQAVVELRGDTQSSEEISELELRLKTQRNIPSSPLDGSLSIMKLNPKTAKPLIDKERDRASQQKIEANINFFKEHPHIKEFKDLAQISNGKRKIAVIHIDGNGLGKLVPKLKDKLSTFSEKLDEATKKAFMDAKDDTMNVRDVILGGDDVTVICSANDALPLTERFLRYFEENTAKMFEELKLDTQQDLSGETKLTACAGIAYANEKYPFHYAVELAEELCGEAKEASGRSASCLMFHNIQSSNFQSWEKFVNDELIIRNEKGIVRCDFGPYYLNRQGEALIGDLMKMVGAYACDGSPISRLRAWIGELGESAYYADEMLKRINEMAKESKEWDSCIMDRNLKNFNPELSSDTLIIEKDNCWKTPIYDVLQIISATEAKR
jgi:CRISPR/Cas system-associated protein Cas10 (large subunit of type III CRISPR-Cas system)